MTKGSLENLSHKVKKFLNNFKLHLFPGKLKCRWMNVVYPQRLKSFLKLSIETHEEGMILHEREYHQINKYIHIIIS